MGVVLAAYDSDLDRKVALQILRDGSRDGSAGAVRMRREAQVTWGKRPVVRVDIVRV